ncbi:MAG: winged helix-turn-helix transcriptional regulator, partial [Bacteroidales bacterium]|nr:winged helix-turn-helix transcriptional regulator [Bacteroidales bacterium]
RVEIRNPGLLYGGLTIEQIKKEMVSERRNELIAEMFHRVHFVEKWGRGISLILSKEPATEFKEVGRHFIAVFKRKLIEERLSAGEKTREKIIILLTHNPEITTEDLSVKIGISVKGIEWQLSKLKKENLIKRIGSKKSGHWEVAKGS